MTAGKSNGSWMPWKNWGFLGNLQTASPSPSLWPEQFDIQTRPSFIR